MIKRFARAIVFGLVLWLPIAGSPSIAQEALPPRLQIGISLLPAVVAANKDLSTQDSGAELPILLLYLEDRHQAEQLRPEVERIAEIRGRKLAISSISLEELLTGDPAQLSSVFIAEPLGAQLDKLTEFAQQRRLLLFSPFKGDVERGVTAGFRVTDKVLPMVNMAALQKTQIQLKAFFLRIAVKYE